MNIGSTIFNSFKLGTNDISKVYIGTDKVYPNSQTPLLDSHPSNCAAYSLRLLSSSYTGDCLQIRRESNNDTLDVGFVNGYLDEASIISFSTGTNSRVVKWYDQSSNSRDAIQIVANNQPLIYNSTTGLYLLNGKSSILWDGVVGTGLKYSSLQGSNKYSVSSVLSTKNVGQYTKLFSVGPDAQTQGVWFTLNTGGTILEWVNNDTGFAGNGYNNPTGPSVISDSRIMIDAIDTQSLLTSVLSSSNASMYKDGTEISYRVQRTGNCFTSSGDLIIGNSPNNVNAIYSKMQELIIWHSDEDSSMTEIHNNTNSYFNIY